MAFLVLPGHWVRGGPKEVRGMRLLSLLGRLPSDREELLLAAVQCATVEELSTLARTNGIELTPLEAGELFEFIHPPGGELSPSELDLVTGGAGDDKEETKACPQCSWEMEYRLERPWLHWSCSNPSCGYETKQFIPF